MLTNEYVYLQTMPNYSQYQVFPSQAQNVQMSTPGVIPVSGQVTMASFDSGARFDGISQPRIPVNIIFLCTCMQWFSV